MVIASVPTNDKLIARPYEPSPCRPTVVVNPVLDDAYRAIQCRQAGGQGRGRANNPGRHLKILRQPNEPGSRRPLASLIEQFKASVRGRNLKCVVIYVVENRNAASLCLHDELMRFC